MSGSKSIPITPGLGYNPRWSARPNRGVWQEVGGHAALGLNLGYHRLKSPSSSSLRTLVRAWSRRCAPRGPLHLLLLDEPSADHLVDRRLNKRGADPLALSPSLTKVWNEVAVVLDVDIKLGQLVGNFRRRNRMRLD